MSWLPKPQLAVFSKCSDEVLVRVVHYSNHILFMNLGKNSDNQSKHYLVNYSLQVFPDNKRVSTLSTLHGVIVVVVKFYFTRGVSSAKAGLPESPLALSCRISHAK